MVVVHDERGGVREQGAFQELARLDYRAVERAAIDLGIVPEEPVPRVQVERARPLLRAVAVGPSKVLLDEGRLIHQIAGGKGLRRQAAADLDRGLDRRGPSPPHPLLARQLAARQAGETGQAAVRGEQPSGAVEGALAAAARAEQQGEKLLGGERGRSRPGEALPRPLVGRKVADAERRAQASRLARMQTVGSPVRSLILVAGIVLVAAAIAWPVVSRYFGRLPGDVVVRRPGFTFVFPIVTCLLLSLLVTFLLWLFRR